MVEEEDRQRISVRVDDVAVVGEESSVDIDKPSDSLYLPAIEYISLSEFYNSGCGGVMLSYSFLYATVLSFGSLMMVYLRWAGLPDHLIGLARGVSSMFGFFGAFVFPMAKHSLGIRKTGLCAIWYQCLNVCVAAASFIMLAKYQAMVAVTVLTLLSRSGLWLYELVVRQIAQETIPEHVRGKVNGQWKSMMSFFDMSIYVAAILASDPTKFWMLTSISASMVLLSAVTFTLTTSAQSFESIG